MFLLIHVSFSATPFGVRADEADNGKLPPVAERPVDSAKSDHWAFKPATRHSVPKVKNETWPGNPIDHFILAKLEAQGLAPSAEADRTTLIRRLNFDLIGLPPTPDEAEAFLADQDPDAYEKVVDRLLKSPRYGERWARHWLDVVHYGESHGYDKDKPRPNAWPYRDYVIRSFNDDKPYSRFVQEQLAGDVLFPDTADGVIATGFIAAGPWDFVGHVELPESKTDGLIARYNDRDDMVMNAISTFLSLTVHCARCHDHKFDPITQEEYYGLQAVFAGVDRADRLFDADPTVAGQRRKLMVERKSLTIRQKELAQILAKTTSAEVQMLDRRSSELGEAHKALLKVGKESPGNGYHSAIEPAPDVEKWVEIDLALSVAIDEVRLIPARPTDFPDTPGFGFPKRFRVETSDDEQFASRQTLLDKMAEDYPNPGDTVVSVPAKNLKARFVRVTATRLWERTRDYVFALSELQVMSGTHNVAFGAKVSALDSIEAGRWGKEKLVDNFDSRKWVVEPAESSETVVRRKELEVEISQTTDRRQTAVEALLDPRTKAAVAEVRARLEQVNKEIGLLPGPQMVYAATSDFKSEGSFAPPVGPRPVHLLKRGDVKRPGRLMSPVALSCVPGLDASLEAADPTEEATRRVALSKWIADSRNMLTRRSIVNRIWQYHFGSGIVDTPNDFGHMGSPPTHLELLDWLAFWFLDSGESLKKLHRLIVTSATYRQRSGAVLEPWSVDRTSRVFQHSNAPSLHYSDDSDNRYLWRMNRQRLDAESFRDTLLFLSGRLDLTMGGPSQQQFYFKDDHSPVYDYTRFDVDSPGSLRRSVYRFIVRSVPDPFMECLDSADASLLTAKRNVTLTALQTLATLNNPFVVRQCEHFAERLKASAKTADDQVRMAFRLSLNREPTPAETRLMSNHVQKHGLANFCRVLVNSSEFVFID
jgi:hypothetical protein